MTTQEKEAEICRRSTIPPEEAQGLLAFHNGDLNKALQDLKQNGLLLPEEQKPKEHKKDEPKKKPLGKTVRQFLLRPYTVRIRLEADGGTVLDFAMLFFGLCVLLAPHMALLGFLAAKLLGYKIRLIKESETFTAERFTQNLRRAWENFKNLFRLEEE